MTPLRILLATLLFANGCVFLFDFDGQTYLPLEEELCERLAAACGTSERCAYFTANDGYDCDGAARELESCWDGGPADLECETLEACAEKAHCRPCDLALRIGDSCLASSCDNPVCADEGAKCMDGRCCIGSGNECENHSDCCTGLCNDGSCEMCVPFFEDCSQGSSTPCCQTDSEAVACLDGVCTSTCDPMQMMPFDTTCDALGGCCHDTLEQCVKPPPNVPAGGVCDHAIAN